MERVQTKVPDRPVMTKAEWREQQRNLTFTEKIVILERLRERSRVIASAGLRKTPHPLNEV
jgi:hypothetical protein